MCISAIVYKWFILVLPECVARVPVSLWGSGGLGVESVFARRCATVRNRPREGRMAVPMVSCAKGVTFGGFTCRIASFRAADVALRDSQTCFGNVSKVVLCGRRNSFATFSEDALQFSWQAQHFGRVHRHFAWICVAGTAL